MAEWQRMEFNVTVSASSIEQPPQDVQFFVLCNNGLGLFGNRLLSGLREGPNLENS